MDVALRNQRIEQYIPLVNKVARQLYNRFPCVRRIGNLDDVVSQGTLGLLDAATRYQDGFTCSFLTYAYHGIRRSIMKGSAELGIIRVPSGSLPAIRAGKSSQRLQERAQQAQTILSLDEAQDWLPDHEEAEDALDRGEQLRSALRSLRWQDRLLMMRVYGLGGVTQRSQVEIAQLRGVSKQYINGLVSQLRRKLRQRMEAMAA